jgi:isoamyl acetate esterase
MSTSSLSKTTTSFRVRPTVLLLGDSLTQEGFGPGGWAARLAGAYTRRADVLNRGYSGYNTSMYLDILPRILGSIKEEDGTGGESTLRGTSGSVDVLFCTVFLGANDAALPGEPQHVPIDQYRQNLQRIVRDVRRATSTASAGSSMDDSTRANAFPIVLCAPPPVDEASWARHLGVPSSNRTNRRTRSYGSCVKQVADSMSNCAFLDTWELLRGDDPQALGSYLSDGLHLNEAGNQKLFEGLMSLISSQFPHLAPMVDGEGKYGTTGVPLEEELWKVRAGLPLSN